MSAQYFNLVEQAPAAKDGDFPVSTRLFTEDGATLVVFRFGPKQVLKEHRAPHPITVRVAKGEVEFAVDGNTHTLTPETVIYVPEGTPHSVFSREGAVMTVTLHTGGSSS